MAPRIQVRWWGRAETRAQPDFGAELRNRTPAMLPAPHWFNSDWVGPVDTQGTFNGTVSPGMVVRCPNNRLGR